MLEIFIKEKKNPLLFLFNNFFVYLVFRTSNPGLPSKTTMWFPSKCVDSPTNRNTRLKVMSFVGSHKQMAKCNVSSRSIKILFCSCM